MAHERRVSPTGWEQTAADRRVAARAAGSWGVLTAAELGDCGLTSTAVSTRLRRGWVHRLHRGVYAVGHASPPWEGRLLAAVRACGPDALLSHYSAAEVWGFVDRLDRVPDVTVIAQGPRTHRGIQIHRSSPLPPEDRRHYEALPLTAPARTLVDLAATLDPSGTRRAVRRALGLQTVTLRQIARVLGRYPRRRGSATLREAVALGAAPVRSEAESDVLDLVLSLGFAHPDVNVPLLINGRRLVPDLRWPTHQLILEIDSDAWHGDPLARADDQERQALLERHGETVLRVHWRDALLWPGRLESMLTAAGAPR
jgi:predicted transcriptional regulator of viral defense system